MLAQVGQTVHIVLTIRTTLMLCCSLTPTIVFSDATTTLTHASPRPSFPHPPSTSFCLYLCALTTATLRLRLFAPYPVFPVSCSFWASSGSVVLPQRYICIFLRTLGAHAVHLSLDPSHSSLVPPSHRCPVSGLHVLCLVPYYPASSCMVCSDLAIHKYLALYLVPLELTVLYIHTINPQL